MGTRTSGSEGGGEQTTTRKHGTAARLRPYKIDRSFVAGLSGDEGNAELVRGIVNLGESLHLDVVVEGIEDADQAEGLRRMGVRLAQGFFFSVPLPPDEVGHLLD
ncbi:MAG: EAL domain-containing protein, partial [Thermoleophilaceae bacterium]